MLVTLYQRGNDFGFDMGNTLGEFKHDNAKLEEVCSRVYKELEGNKELIKKLLNK